MVEHLEPGQRNLAVLRYSGQFSPQTDLSTYNRRAVKQHGFLLDRLIQNRAVVLPLKKGAIMLFNKKKKQAGANTVNLAGGEAFTETTQLELVALMLNRAAVGRGCRHRKSVRRSRTAENLHHLRQLQQCRSVQLHGRARFRWRCRRLFSGRLVSHPH